MAFKPRGQQKSPNDLMGLLVNSKIQTENNALYQTIFGLITIQATFMESTATALKLLKEQADSKETKDEGGIPAFFFMGSS